MKQPPANQPVAQKVTPNNKPISERPKGWGGESIEVEQLWAWTDDDKPIKIKLSDGREYVGMCRRVERFWIALFADDKTILINKGFIVTIEAA